MKKSLIVLLTISLLGLLSFCVYLNIKLDKTQKNLDNAYILIGEIIDNEDDLKFAINDSKINTRQEYKEIVFGVEAKLRSASPYFCIKKVDIKEDVNDNSNELQYIGFNGDIEKEIIIEQDNSLYTHYHVFILTSDGEVYGGKDNGDDSANNPPDGDIYFNKITNLPEKIVAMYEEVYEEFEDGVSKYIVFVDNNGVRYCIPQYSLNFDDIRTYDEVFNNENHT